MAVSFFIQPSSKCQIAWGNLARFVLLGQSGGALVSSVFGISPGEKIKRIIRNISFLSPFYLLTKSRRSTKAPLFACLKTAGFRTLYAVLKRLRFLVVPLGMTGLTYLSFLLSLYLLLCTWYLLVLKSVSLVPLFRGGRCLFLFLPVSIAIVFLSLFQIGNPLQFVRRRLSHWHFLLVNTPSI
jgi:hypothetical protein